MKKTVLFILFIIIQIPISGTEGRWPISDFKPFEKVSADKFLEEKDISESNKNICRLYIKTTVSETPIVIKIEEGKEKGIISVKGAEKDKLNFYYKYIKDGTYFIDFKTTQMFFQNVQNKRFFGKKDIKNEEKGSFLEREDNYILECKIDKRYNVLRGKEVVEKDCLWNIPTDIQMLTAQTVPKGDYNFEKEVREYFERVMKDKNKPICQKGNKRELSIITVSPSWNKEKEESLFFLFRLLQTKNSCDLNFRALGDYSLFYYQEFDITKIAPDKADEFLNEAFKIIDKIKVETPKFIWKNWAYDFAYFYGENGDCKIVYDLHKSFRDKRTILDEIWSMLKKGISDMLFLKEGNKNVKKYMENPD